MVQGSGTKPAGSQQHDAYGKRGSSWLRRIARFIARAIGILIGLGIAAFGIGFYMLRCSSSCPTDPAENVTSQILTLSLVGFGLVVVVAAVSLVTRSAVVGAWIITVVGGLMATGGVVALAMAPSLRVAADQPSTIMYALLDVIMGAACMALGRRVRRRPS